jgi:hypothetical protein
MDRVRAKVLDCEEKNKHCQAMYIAAQILGINLCPYKDRMYQYIDETLLNDINKKIKICLPQKTN